MCVLDRITENFLEKDIWLNIENLQRMIYLVFYTHATLLRNKFDIP